MQKPHIINTGLHLPFQNDLSFLSFVSHILPLPDTAVHTRRVLLARLFCRTRCGQLLTDSKDYANSHAVSNTFMSLLHKQAQPTWNWHLCYEFRSSAAVLPHNFGKFLLVCFTGRLDRYLWETVNIDAFQIMCIKRTLPIYGKVSADSFSPSKLYWLMLFILLSHSKSPSWLSSSVKSYWRTPWLMT